MLRNNFNYKNVTNHLNNLFVDLNQNIIKKVEESTNIKYRERKTNFIDALNYKFNYSVPGKSKEQVIAEINTKKMKQQIEDHMIIEKNKLVLIFIMTFIIKLKIYTIN